MTGYVARRVALAALVVAGVIIATFVIARVVPGDPAATWAGPHGSAAQVAETAARHFSGATDQVLVAVDGASLGEALKWEPSRGGDLFPHLYAALGLDAVLWIKPLPLGADGRHVFPELAP